MRCSGSAFPQSNCWRMGGLFHAARDVLACCMSRGHLRDWPYPSHGAWTAPKRPRAAAACPRCCSLRTLAPSPSHIINLGFHALMRLRPFIAPSVERVPANRRPALHCAGGQHPWLATCRPRGKPSPVCPCAQDAISTAAGQVATVRQRPLFTRQLLRGNPIRCSRCISTPYVFTTSSRMLRWCIRLSHTLRKLDVSYYNTSCCQRPSCSATYYFII